MPIVMQGKPSDTNVLDEKHNDITLITHKPGNLEKFNIPSLAEKEAARREFLRRYDAGEEMDAATGRPMAEVTSFDPLADVRSEAPDNPDDVLFLEGDEDEVKNSPEPDSLNAVGIVEESDANPPKTEVSEITREMPSLPCGPSLSWLESQPALVRELYAAKLARLNAVGIPDAENLALQRTFEEATRLIVSLPESKDVIEEGKI